MSNCEKCNGTGNVGIYHPLTFELSVTPCKDCRAKSLFELQTKILRMKNAQYARDHGIPIPKNYLKGDAFER